MGREEYQAGDLVFAMMMLFIVLVLLVSIPFETKWFDGVPLVKQPRLWPTFCLVGMALFGLLYSIQIWRSYKIQLGQVQGELNELSSWLRPLEFVFYFVLYVLSHNGMSLPENYQNVNTYLFTGGVYFVNNFCL